MPEYVAPEAVDAYVVYEGAELPEPDLDAPLIEHRYERTVPKVTGAPWDMAKWIREDRARRGALGDFDAGGHVEQVAPGWEIDQSELPRAPKAIAKKLTGWDVRCSACIVYVTPTLFVNATDSHAKGDLRYPDHDDTFWSIQAVLRSAAAKPVAAFWATWVTREEVGRKTATKYQDAITWDPVLGKEFSGTAGEFTEWLAVFVHP